MPKSKKERGNQLKLWSGQGVLNAAQEPFVNTLISKVGESFANTIIPSTIPVISFLNPPVAAAAGAMGSYILNATKRKASSYSAGEIECGVREHSDDFQYVYNNDEITNKRQRVVDNFVPREKEEQNLDALFNIPKPVTSFVERGEIEELCENFEKNCFMQVLTSQVSIVGLGGIGKTQLAAKFVEKIKENMKAIFGSMLRGIVSLTHLNN